MRTVLATAADARYGYHLLSMVGSVQRNSDEFDGIIAFDLGLSPRQRRLLESIRGVKIREVPAFSPHWSQGFTWKPWIWTHLDADRVFYLDAGATVLRSLAPVLAAIEERGYWVVSQGHHADALFPSDWYELYGIDRGRARRLAVAAGIIGFATSGRFWDEVVVPTYEDCVAGRSLGFSPADAERLNFGLGREKAPPLRDAPAFRHDQSVLNARFLRAYPDAEIADLDRWAGFRSPRDHPEQTIWSHRRGGDFRYLDKARYPLGGRVEAWLVARWLRRHIALVRVRSLLRPSVYRARLVARLGRRFERAPRS